jgi:defect-in-organelle-trafficking protein DotC
MTSRCFAPIVGFIAVCAAALFFLVAFPATGRGQGTPEELRKIMDLRGTPAKQREQNVNTTRGRVLANTAKTIGFQHGFAYRYGQILRSVTHRTHEFDRIFNFTPLLINGRVLPPVILWTGHAVNVESDVFATMVSAQYRIIHPARIVATAPSWRDYIEVDATTMQASPAIFPQTSDERALWREFVVQGWNEGMLHADEVFDLNMNRLLADYRGILRFKMLADQGLVRVPVLAEGHLGIQVGDRILNMDQTTFRITVPASFMQGEAKK